MDPNALLKTTKEFEEIASELGILDAVKKKLASQPDIAASKLASALEELQKTILAFEAEVVPFLAIILQPASPEYRRDLALLYSLEGGSAWGKASAARGHCGKIWNIYDQYLNPWFKRITKLNEGERRALKQLFEELRNTDNAMVKLIEEAAMWLGDSARQVLDHVEKSSIDEANVTIARARKQILPVRRSLMQTLASIRELEADFIGMSGVT
jgi:hypothetical protein